MEAACKIEGTCDIWYFHVVSVTCWICWIPLLHSQHVSAPSVGQTNMDGNKLTSSTFYSEVHFEYHMTAGSSSSFFKIFFQILVDFQDFWGFKFISEWIILWLAAKCSIRMISDLSRSIRTRDWPTSRLVQCIWSNITVFVDRF